MTDKPVHTKKPLTRPSVVQIEDAIRKSAGNVTYAAKALGVGRTALHARIAKSPQLQQVLREERESLVDMAESALRAEVLNRNMTAVIWTLKASPEAKRRGWGERHELTGKEGGPVEVTWKEEVVALLRRHEIDPADVRAAYPQLADEFFRQAGVTVTGDTASDG